ncbi:type IV secretion system protein [Paenalcaligenes hermetiae]|uniref:Type IV secretion system protein VirB5 n=2 Tax=Paenalcaligenes hermetiae TaxID=1157987 RepID=A0ABP9M5W1_9BURK
MLRAVNWALVGLLMVSGSLWAQGIPTIDKAAITQFVQQVAHMKEQIDNQIAQINELKAQVEAVTGQRAKGSLYRTNVPDRIPSEWSEIYQLAGVSIDHLKDPKAAVDEAELKGLAVIYEQSEVALTDTQLRLDNINALMDQINVTTDIKDSADLQSRIAAEQAIIANNQIKLDQMARMYELQKDVIYQQTTARDACILEHWSSDNTDVCY